MEITKDQLINLLDTLDVGVIYTDIDGNMLFINDLAEEIRGIRREEKIGTNVIDCHAAKGKPNVQKLLDQFKDGSVGHRHRLVHIKDKYFDNKYLVVREPDSPPSGIVLMSQDVTEKVQLKKQLDDHYHTLKNEIDKKSREIEARYDELMKMQQRLMHSEKMSSIGQFVSIVAHEVNNPLDGIKNCLQAIQDEPENLVQTAKYSSLALEALTKIEEVTKLILNYARPDNYHMEKIDIYDIVQESIRFTRFKLERNNIGIEVSCKKNLSVNASRQHMTQVFMNMVLNSIDAIQEKRSRTHENQPIPDQKDSIRISIDDCDENVCVTLSDTGCGIHSDDIKQLFKPFYTTKKDKGTGLGLYICFNIIYIHNGRITVSSKPDNGTSFTIHIPKYSYSDIDKSMERASELKKRVLDGYVQ